MQRSRCSSAGGESVTGRRMKVGSKACVLPCACCHTIITRHNVCSGRGFSFRSFYFLNAEDEAKREERRKEAERERDQREKEEVEERLRERDDEKTRRVVEQR